MTHREPFSPTETDATRTPDEASILDSTASRRAFLRSGLLLGAATGVVLALPATPAHALKMTYGDAQRLRFLEEIQTLQADFFRRAAQSATADGLQEREMTALNVMAQEDGQQKRWCAIAMRKYGGAAFSMAPTNQSSSKVPKTFNFGADVFNSRENLLKMAIELKTVAVGAWTHAAGEVYEAELSSALASLGGVQNRHLALLQEVSGQNALVTMAMPMLPRQTLRALADYGFTSEVLF